MSSVFSGLTNLATGGLFGSGAGNQSPFAYSPQVGQAMTEALKNYQNLYGQIGANQGGFVNAQIAPMQQSNALGYGNLLQEQGLRGVRGSSFGNQDIANYQNLANTNIANQTANALMQSYGLLGGVNQGISGIGNQLAQQQLGAQGANTAIQQANLQGNLANMGVFGQLMGGISSLMGGGGGGMPSPQALSQFMALG